MWERRDRALRRLLFSGTVLLLALQLGGCAASLARKIRLEAVQEVRTYGTAGADLTLWMTNESRRTVRLEAACVDFYTDSVFLGRVRLRDTVVLAKRSSEEVKSRWKNESPDVAGWYVLEKRLREQDLGLLDVTVEFTVKAGAFRRTIYWERVPVSNFLNIFAPDGKDLVDDK